MLPIVLLAATAAASPSVAPDRGIDAPYPNTWGGVVYAPTPFTISADKAHRDRLLALRKEALDQQTRDGGTLTADHYAELQRKLDTIQLRFAEDRRRADPFSVDANGQAVYSAGNRPRYVLPPGMRFESESR